jgi:hypothetical protein
MSSEAVIVLEAGTVVDRSKLASMSNEKIAEIMADLYKTPDARVVFTDNAARFFSVDSVLAALETDTAPHLDLLLAYNSLQLASEDLAAVERSMRVKKYVRDTIKERIKSSLPLYVFETVPSDWNIDTNLTITSRIIRRVNRGEWESYSIGVKTCESLWLHVAPLWAKQVRHLDTYYVRASGYNESTRATDTNVQIGCQTVQRYELEQVALKFGWAFPTTATTEQ